MLCRCPKPPPLVDPHWLKLPPLAQLHEGLVVVVHVGAFLSWRDGAGKAVHLHVVVQVVAVRRPIAVLDGHHVAEVLDRHRNVAALAAQSFCLPGRPRDYLSMSFFKTASSIWSITSLFHMPNLKRSCRSS